MWEQDVGVRVPQDLLLYLTDSIGRKRESINSLMADEGRDGMLTKSDTMQTITKKGNH